MADSNEDIHSKYDKIMQEARIMAFLHLVHANPDMALVDVAALAEDCELDDISIRAFIGGIPSTPQEWIAKLGGQIKQNESVQRKALPPSPQAKKSKTRGKKKSVKSRRSKKKSTTKPTTKTEPEPLEFREGADWTVYKESIKTALRSAKARNKESAILNRQIREVVGGTTKQVRDACIEMIKAEQIQTIGKARGTRYFI